MVTRKTTMVEHMRMRLVEAGEGASAVFCGSFWLLTQHDAAPQFTGLRFLSRNQHEAERKYEVAVENEMARQSMERVYG